jgi:hypothetical protein
MTSKMSARYRREHKAGPRKTHLQGGDDFMYHFKEMAEFAAALDMKMAVVQVKPGETNTDAWSRHLKDHPHDANAMVKVFNQPQRMNRVSRA